jgi:molybdopterin-binding protein
MLLTVPTYRISEAAGLLGVSDDTVRRWADNGRLHTVVDDSGRKAIEGSTLAAFAKELAAAEPFLAPAPVVGASARNRFPGIVTRVLRDGIMAQVEIQAGPFRLVSLMTREAADELGLEPGVLAVGSVKATNVVVELPEHS